MADTDPGPLPSPRRMLLPVVVVLLLFGIPHLLQPVAQTLMVIFAGVMLAIFLDGATRLLRRAVPLPHAAALLTTIVLLTALASLFFYFAGANIAAQTTELVQRLPQAVETLQSRLGEVPWLRDFLSQAGSGGDIGKELMGRLATLFTATFGAAANAFIIAVIGIYIAFTPRVYVSGMLKLLPRSFRPRGEEVLASLGQAMRWWLVGRLSSMAVVGILTTAGLLLIGQPLALVLGVIAALFSFIPFLGPVISAVPAVLAGLTQGLSMAGWVLAVYAAVQLLESNLITPLIERKAVMLPPAFVISAQVISGVLLGFFGILLATPLTVLATVLVQMLYVEGVLGEDVTVLGDHR